MRVHLVGIAITVSGIVVASGALGAQQPRVEKKTGVTATAKSTFPQSAEVLDATPTQQKVIPRVVGRPVAEARKMLAFTRHTILQVDSVAPGVPVDQVILQRPRDGTPVAAVKADTLWVAVAQRSAKIGTTPVSAIAGTFHPARPDSTKKPPGPVVVAPPVSRDTLVPDLRGLQQPLVGRVLSANMLRLQGESTDFSDLQPEGRVFRQDPPAQTQVRKGSGVTVWISKGPHVEPPPDVKPSPTVKPAPRPPKPPEPKPPEPKPPEPPTVTVPPLYGFTIERAHDSLRRVGLDTGRVNRIARAGGRGTVEHQEPHEGAKLHPKDVVDLTIAVPPPMVKVPPVVGLTLRAAEASLDVFGLETGVVSRQPVKVGNSGVLSQDPPAGALVEAKSAVALTIGVLIVEPPVAVPDLARQTRAGADSLLVARGLRLGAVFADSASATLTVVSQDPLAGDSVVAGTPVSVRLGGGDGPYFRVPNVVRLSLDSARASLRSAGLTRVAVDGFLDANAVVVLQNPQEGTSVPASAVIALVADSLMIPVPYLLGLTEEEARNRAAGDRLSIGLLPSHRGFVFRTVVDSQVPARPASIRASGAMSVQLVTPIVPPVVLAAFGLGALGLVVVPGPRRRILDTLRRIIKRPPVPPDPGPHPPPAPSVTLVPVVQGQKLLTLDDAGRDSLVKNVLSLSFDVTRDAATLHVNEPTITKPGSWRDA